MQERLHQGDDPRSIAGVGRCMNNRDAGERGCCRDPGVPRVTSPQKYHETLISAMLLHCQVRTHSCFSRPKRPPYAHLKPTIQDGSTKTTVESEVTSSMMVAKCTRLPRNQDCTFFFYSAFYFPAISFTLPLGRGIDCRCSIFSLRLSLTAAPTRSLSPRHSSLSASLSGPLVVSRTNTWFVATRTLH